MLDRKSPNGASSPQRPASACVYVIAAEKIGPVKIGWANNPAKRVTDLQTGNPNRLYVFFAAVMPTAGHAMSIEAAAHRQLEAKRGVGEWFHIPTDLAITELAALVLEKTGRPPVKWKPVQAEIERRLIQLGQAVRPYRKRETPAMTKRRRAEEALTEYNYLRDITR